jgi:hypothetical protein
MRRFSDPRVASLFKAYPAAVRAELMALRELVLDTAERTAGVGYEGERAMHFAIKDRLPVRELRHCIALALTHHLRKKARRGG